MRYSFALCIILDRKQLDVIPIDEYQLKQYAVSIHWSTKLAVSYSLQNVQIKQINGEFSVWLFFSFGLKK